MKLLYSYQISPKSFGDLILKMFWLDKTNYSTVIKIYIFLNYQSLVTISINQIDKRTFRLDLAYTTTPSLI